MPEGVTTLLYKEHDKPVINDLLDTIRSLGIEELIETFFEEQKIHSSSFEHSGDYSALKFNNILKKAVESSTFDFLRSVHMDDHGTEIFWLLSENKIKKYTHNVDELEESSSVVKAYRHWHSEMNGLWFGRVSNEDIEIMAEKFGQYDEKGKKITQPFLDYKSLIQKSESFLKNSLRAPYASVKWNFQIPVYESFARLYASESNFTVDNDSFKFQRTYCFPDVIGFIWSWSCNGKNVVLLLKLEGNNGMAGTLVLNKDSISIDAIAILDNYANSRWNNYEYDYGQHVDISFPLDNSNKWIPAVCELEHDLLENYSHLRKAYHFDGLVMNVTCNIVKANSGLYHCLDDSQKVLVEMYDEVFCKWLDSLAHEKYYRSNESFEKALWSNTLDADLETNKIFSELQVEFDENMNVRRTLNCKVKILIQSKNGKVSKKTFAEYTG